VGDAPIDRLNCRPTTVHQDWLAWLPEAKGALFQAISDDLEVSYTILSLALDDALRFCNQGRLPLAREQAQIFSSLFDRVASRLRGALRTLDEHGRHSGTTATVAPLQVDLFRNNQAQTVARANYLLSMVSLRRPGRFFRKVAALDDLVTKLQSQARIITAEIWDGTSLRLPLQWTNLEVLHHDLNTCFCETSIVLKSFLRAMPDAELLSFRKRLLSLIPASEAAHPERPARFVTKIVPACQPEPEASLAQAAVAEDSEDARRRRRLLNS
jgi:hypothetical protein